MAIETPAPARPGVAPVRRIEDLTHDDIPYAGGKGGNLGELTRAGFAVPPGFVIGAPADARLHPEYAELLARTRVGDG